MPRLGSILACEKVLNDTGGKPTLISIFQKIGAIVPQGQAVPTQTIAGITWTVFCEWFFTKDEAESNRNYEQVLEVMLPDKTPSPLRGRLPLKERPKDENLGARAFVNMFGVPIAQVGFLIINVWLECDSERVTDVSSYHIQIEHSEQPPAPGEASSFLAFSPQQKSAQ
jgi:hypothetical protein